jgi:2-keto-4-pentenoate hydratase
MVSPTVHANSAEAILLAPRLSDEQVRSAADMLVALREGRSDVKVFPADLVPANTIDVQRIIDAVSGRIGRPVRGWKTYTVAKNLNPPFIAPVYEVFPDGSNIPAEFSPERLIEPEIMFRVDRDLPARDKNYGLIEIMDSVSAVVGFEVLCSRFPPEIPFGERAPYASFADHIGNGCVVVGDVIRDWRDVEFEDVPLTVTEDHRKLASVVGSHPFDNPFLSVVMCVNRVRRRADLHKGDIIVSSATTSFFPVNSGTLIRATYEGVGEVTATLAGGPPGSGLHAWHESSPWTPDPGVS